MVNPTTPPVPTTIFGLPPVPVSVGAGDFIPIVQNGKTYHATATQVVTGGGGGGGGGSVTAIGVTTANGVSGVSSGGTTPNLTITLGAITPSSVNSVVISGASTPTLAITGTTSVSGSNTGDQTITLTGDVTGAGTGSFATTIATNAVTYAKMQTASTVTLLGNPTGGTAAIQEITLGSGLSFSGSTLTASGGGGSGIVFPQGRLSLNPGEPVMQASNTGTGAVVYIPYVGNNCPIWNGSAWVQEVIPDAGSIDLVLTVSAHAANHIYDVYAFMSSGSFTLGTSPAWSNTTTRSTGLTLLDGIYVNHLSFTATNSTSTYTVGANQGTYLGTILISPTAGTTSMTFNPTIASGGNACQLGVWNCYNRVRTTCIDGDSTASWNYSTGTWRPLNNSTSNRMTYVDGLGESFIDVEFCIPNYTSGSGGSFFGINQSSTTATPVNFLIYGIAADATALSTGFWQFIPTMGSYYLQTMEYGQSGCTMVGAKGQMTKWSLEM